MCFSPQRQAIFRQQNVKKCSEPVMFCTFWLSNVLFATAACNFSTSELQKVVQTCGVLYILTCKCAFRHSGVQFLSSPLSTDLRTRRFNRPTFRLTRHTNHWKKQHFATSLTFGADVSSFFWLSRYCSFCRLTWRLYCWAMHLLFNCPYCRKFLFKLPSITDITKYFSQNALAKGHTLHFNDDWVKRTPNSSSGPRQSPCMVQFLTDPSYMIHHVLIWSFFGSWYRCPIASKHIQGARSPKAYFPQHPAAKSWHSLEIPNHQTTETFYVPWMNHAQWRGIQ